MAKKMAVLFVINKRVEKVSGIAAVNPIFDRTMLGCYTKDGDLMNIIPMNKVCYIETYDDGEDEPEAITAEEVK